MSNLFSSKAPTIPFREPGNFTSGGFNFSGEGGVTPTAARSGLVSDLSGASGNEADILGGLRSTVTPGFNDLLSARLADLNNSARSAIGDLRDNLASRRILGSSFGNDTINRLQTGINQQRDSIIADNFLKSLAANQQLTQQQFAAKKEQFQTALNELNLEANLGQQINAAATNAFNANAKAQAELDQKYAAGSGSFLSSIIGKVAGPTLGTIGNGIASGLGSLFGAGATSAGTIGGTALAGLPLIF